MKYFDVILYFTSLVVISFIFYINSGPDFKKNDCLINGNLEAWETKVIYKVKEVGRNHYLLSPSFGNGYIPAIDNTLILTECENQ